MDDAAGCARNCQAPEGELDVGVGLLDFEDASGGHRVFARAPQRVGAERGPPRPFARQPRMPQQSGAQRVRDRAQIGTPGIRVLDAWDVAEETIDQALLVVFELVTNAVEHARPPVALHLQRPGNDGVLRIEVGDGGPADHEGAWTTSCAPEERGRGRGIIALMACAHGTRVLAHTVTHWAVLPAAASRGSPR